MVYLQKTSFVAGITMLFQILLGHRLPLIAGPSTVLLIGVLASRGLDPAVVNSSICLGGVLLALVSLTGFFGHIRRLFTKRVIATVLLLIAFTLTPAILKLLTTANPTGTTVGNLSFAFALSVLLLFGNRHLKGIWRSSFIMWSMMVATVFYFLLLPGPWPSFDGTLPVASVFFRDYTMRFSFDVGVFLSFIFCFLGLSINDLGSMESIAELVKAKDTEQRVNRGITVTGSANVLSGILGIVGPVNFSLSPGIVLSTGCASRFALLPTALILILLAFFPSMIRIVGSVPPVVIGATLLYILCFQVAAGLTVLIEGEPFSMESGLIIGLPLLLANIMAFLPSELLSSFPAVVRPLVGNGFVVGVGLVLILEHLVFGGSANLIKPTGKMTK